MHALTHLVGDAAPFTQLPAGRHGLSREQVTASQRARLLQAVVDEVGQQGYAATIVADVTTRAGVSKKTFYVHFQNKEECFAAAYDAFSAYLLTEMEQAGQSCVGGWRERYLASLERYAELLTAHPGRTRALIVEVLAAGPVLLQRRGEVLHRFARHLQATYRAAAAEASVAPEVDPELFVLLVGGGDELLRKLILEDKVEQIRRLPTMLHATFERLVPHTS